MQKDLENLLDAAVKARGRLLLAKFSKNPKKSSDSSFDVTDSPKVKKIEKKVA